MTDAEKIAIAGAFLDKLSEVPRWNVNQLLTILLMFEVRELITKIDELS
jgi:hypothetical protein